MKDYLARLAETTFEVITAYNKLEVGAGFFVIACVLFSVLGFFFPETVIGSAVSLAKNLIIFGCFLLTCLGIHSIWSYAVDSFMRNFKQA